LLTLLGSILHFEGPDDFSILLLVVHVDTTIASTCGQFSSIVIVLRVVLKNVSIIDTIMAWCVVLIWWAMLNYVDQWNQLPCVRSSAQKY
jgi:hypothetical protein